MSNRSNERNLNKLPSQYIPLKYAQNKNKESLFLFCAYFDFTIPKLLINIIQINMGKDKDRSGFSDKGAKRPERKGILEDHTISYYRRISELLKTDFETKEEKGDHH